MESTISDDQKALLIVDMQTGSFEDSPRWNADGVVACLNEWADRFRAEGAPVYWIMHDGTSFGDFIPGTSRWELVDGLVRRADEPMIAKTANDAFYGTGLAERLRKERIQEVWIGGCATDFCVAATVQGAIFHDFDVKVLSGGHTTADRPHAKAEVIRAHYEYIWADWLPTQGKVEVVPR
ncbi:isochorismatase family protein [Pontibacter sp. G13]|uniref:isochorismatase family protein n=1 Tax=Pontibacter sp. G13 TaxID=3074898 RepID=UPI00288AA53D|nr:isochorismatase family protein [Pontibacter sp. G13]WNJ17927.1 isochorismatase family protein [Pontibacter sp. G13]